MSAQTHPPKGHTLRGHTPSTRSVCLSGVVYLCGGCGLVLTPRSALIESAARVESAGHHTLNQVAECCALG